MPLVLNMKQIIFHLFIFIYYIYMYNYINIKYAVFLKLKNGFHVTFL